MKKKAALLLMLSASFCFGQSYAEMCKELGLSISYFYKKTGNTLVNPLTDSKFDEYVITCVAENSSDKCVGFKDPIIDLNLSGVDFGNDDNRFVAEKAGRMSGHLNHHYNDSKCVCVDARGYNTGVLISLCPKSKSETHYVFVYPQSFTPNIKWYECYVQQIEDGSMTGTKTAVIKNEKNESHEADNELIKLPEFPGGSSAFAQMIIDGFNWNNIKGEGETKVFLKFTVMRDGTIGDLEVSGENASLNAETLHAAGLVTTLWVPGRTKNGEVNCSHTLPIAIRL